MPFLPCEQLAQLFAWIHRSFNHHHEVTVFPSCRLTGAELEIEAQRSGSRPMLLRTPGATRADPLALIQTAVFADGEADEWAQ